MDGTVEAPTERETGFDWSSFRHGTNALFAGMVWVNVFTGLWILALLIALCMLAQLIVDFISEDTPSWMGIVSGISFLSALWALIVCLAVR